MKNQEVELKLTLPAGPASLRPAALRRLLGASGSTRHQSLETVYFDTPKSWLKDHGMALRVRKVGTKRIQTLKVPGSSLDGLQSFVEFEAEIRGNRPILAAIADGKIRRRLERNGVMAQLRAVFTTRFERATWLITRGDSQIEVALDIGGIDVKSAKAPIAEIELELKSGQPVELFHCAERLAEDIPARLGSATKAARGYALAYDLKASPARAEPLELDRKGSADDAFRS